MAEVGINASDASGLLGAVMDSFARKQGLAQQDAADTLAASQAIRDSASLHSAQTAEAARSTAAVIAKGQEARQLADGGLGGVMELMFKQVFDADYTQDGRTQTLGAINTSLGMAGQVHNANVLNAQSQLAAKQAGRAQDVLNADATLLSLQTRVNTIGTIQQGVAASENLRLQSLGQMDKGAVDAALGNPLLAKTGSIEIGGFKFSQTELVERQRGIVIRDALSKLTPQQADPNYAAALRSIHEVTMMHMSYNELLEIQKNGGTMPDGTQADNQQLNQFVAEKGQQATQRLVLSMDETLGRAQFPLALTDLNKTLTHFSSTLKPGDPLYSEAQRMRAATALVLQNEDKANATPGGISMLMGQINAITDEFGKKVTTEAKRQANGDEQLTEIIRNRMYGLPPDPVQMTDYVVNAYTNQKPFGAALPQSEAAAIQLSIDAEMALTNEALRSDTMGDMPRTASDMKTYRAEAARRGIEAYTSQKALQGVNLIPRIGMETRKDNPITVAGISPSQYSQIESQAEQEARNAVLGGTELPPNALALIQEGKGSTIGLTPAQAQALIEEYNVQQIMFEYDLLESVAPGTAQAYSTWLATNQSQLLDAATAHPSISGTASLTREKIQANSQIVSNLWGMARENATGRGLQVMKEAALKARNPVKMYTTAFGMIDSVTEEQKSMVLGKIVMPILNSAEQQGLSRERIAEMIQNGLLTGVEGEPALNRAAKQIIQALPGTLGQYETVIQMLTDSRNNGGVGPDDASQIRGLLGNQTSGRSQIERQSVSNALGHSAGQPFTFTPSRAPPRVVPQDSRGLVENSSGALVDAINQMRDQ